MRSCRRQLLIITDWEMTRLHTLDSSTESGPGVSFPPPMLFILCGFAGHLVECVFLSPGQSAMASFAPAGWGLIVVTGTCLFWALSTFRSAHTAIFPNKRANQIINNGPYRFSRNPMYVALAGIQAGVGIVACNLWMLLFVPLSLCLVHFLVVRREEAYLRSEFGDAYRAYCESVRRWI